MIADATADYTDEQLRAAWAACRPRTWPDTFEETMADPVRAQMVRLHAWHIANPRKVAAEPAARLATPCPAPSAAPAPHRFALTHPPGYVDRKRAASGEREDD